MTEDGRRKKYDRSKYLSGAELCDRLGIAAPGLYHRMEGDPDFPKMMRPSGLGNVTLFSISEVEAYEEKQEERREDLIQRIVAAVERELRSSRGVQLSRAYAAMQRERWRGRRARKL